MLEERQAEVRGIRVGYRVAGTGPPAVLVHGLAGSWRWWEPVVDPLAAKLRIHLIDLPGFGSARGQAFDLAGAPSYVRALIEQIGLERPHLIGHSLGGAVGARVAARWPETVDRLVLAAPAGLLERRHPVHYGIALAEALRRAPPTFVRVLVADVARAGLRTLYRGAKQLLADKTLRDELPSISAPTLLIWGEHDPLVPLPLVKEYERAIPNARLVVLKGAGHVPMFERPDDFARAVLTFIAEGSSPGDANGGLER